MSHEPGWPSSQPSSTGARRALTRPSASGASPCHRFRARRLSSAGVSSQTSGGELYGSEELQFPDFDHWALVKDAPAPAPIECYISRS